MLTGFIDQWLLTCVYMEVCGDRLYFLLLVAIRGAASLSLLDQNDRFNQHEKKHCSSSSGHLVAGSRSEDRRCVFSCFMFAKGQKSEDEQSVSNGDQSVIRLIYHVCVRIRLKRSKPVHYHVVTSFTPRSSLLCASDSNSTCEQSDHKVQQKTGTQSFHRSQRLLNYCRFHSAGSFLTNETFEA